MDAVKTSKDFSDSSELKDVRVSEADDRRRESRFAVDETASIKMLSPLESGHFDAQILDISRHGLKIRTQMLVQRGVILQVRLREILIMAEARYCFSVENGFYVGLYIQDCVERRKSERVDVDIATTIIKLANAVEAQEEYPARILNQSSKGLMLAVARRIRPGSVVQVGCGGMLLVAKVVYCIPMQGEFNVGLEIGST